MADGAPPARRAGLKRLLLETRAGRLALIGPRLGLALRDSHIAPRIAQILTWSVRSREIANFTYETTRESKLLLAAIVAEIAGRPVTEIVGYVDELAADRALADHVTGVASTGSARWSTDPGFLPGRRLAYYLLTRAMKPGLVVEAGVDKGLGAVLVSRALALNEAEGFGGDYVGIEHDPAKPIPLLETFAQKRGRIVRGDSVRWLQREQGPIDLFIHDTIPDSGHLIAQLDAARRRLTSRGVIASTWTTAALIDHAIAEEAHLLTHQEETLDHWFPGDRVAFIFGYGGSGPR